MPFDRAVDVKPMENYLIVVRFESGAARLFNCLILSKNKLYEKIFDKDYFRSVHIDDMGLVCWDIATDIEPDFLWDHSEELSHFQNIF